MARGFVTFYVELRVNGQVSTSAFGHNRQPFVLQDTMHILHMSDNTSLMEGNIPLKITAENVLARPDHIFCRFTPLNSTSPPVVVRATFPAGSLPGFCASQCNFTCLIPDMNHGAVEVAISTNEVHWSAPAMLTVLPCPRGWRSPNPRVRCEPCDAGQFSTPDQKTCKTCPLHTFSFQSGTPDACIACPNNSVATSSPRDSLQK